MNSVMQSASKPITQRRYTVSLEYAHELARVTVTAELMAHDAGDAIDIVASIASNGTDGTRLVASRVVSTQAQREQLAREAPSPDQRPPLAARTPVAVCPPTASKGAVS